MTRPVEIRIEALRQKIQRNLDLADRYRRVIRALSAGFTSTGEPDRRGGGRRVIPLGSTADIMAMRAAGKTLAEIGGKYGVSRERIRQIISVADKRNGTAINAAAKTAVFRKLGRSRTVPKQARTCPECGTIFSVLPSSTKKTCANRLCVQRHRSVAAQSRRVFTDGIIRLAIDLRYEGRSWVDIHKAVGAGSQPIALASAVYRYLARENMLRQDIVQDLFSSRGRTLHIASFASRFGWPSESGEASRENLSATP